jgi:hypothetical protein
MTLKQNNLIGLILIIAGGLALLGNFGILGGVPEIFFSAAMAAIGAYLVRYHLMNRGHFWASIVGFSLFGLALAAISGNWAGFYFLGLIGGGFATTYMMNHKHWWAVIPAGVLWTLSLMVLADNLFPRWDAGALLFAGFAATFGYLFAYERKHWAVYPAVALLIVGLLTLSSTGGWVFPGLLIAGGIYLVNRQKKEVTSSATSTPIVTAPGVTTPVVTTASVDTSSLAEKPVDNVNVEEPMSSETLARQLEADSDTVTAENPNTPDENTNKQNS